MSRRMKHYLSEYAVGLFMVALFIACLFFIPKFASATNLLNISTQVAINGLIATGMTFVILTGGIDLSVGAVAALASIFAADICLKLGDPGVMASLMVFLTVSLGFGTV